MELRHRIAWWRRRLWWLPRATDLPAFLKWPMSSAGRPITGIWKYQPGITGKVWLIRRSRAVLTIMFKPLHGSSNAKGFSDKSFTTRAKINDPSKPRLTWLITRTGAAWARPKGKIYEGLLEKKRKIPRVAPASILLPRWSGAMVALHAWSPWKPLPIRPVEPGGGFSLGLWFGLQILSIIHWIKTKGVSQTQNLYGNEIVANTPYGIDEPLSPQYWWFWERRLYLQPMPWFQTVACG